MNIKHQRSSAAASSAAGPVLGGDPRLPRYERLRETLAARVRAGEWGMGEPLPAEPSLASAYGVALGTLRRAVAGLVDVGLLERRQGRGTYVRQGGDFSSSTFRFFRVQGEGGVEGRGGGDLRPEARLLVREIGPASQEVSDALRLDAGKACIHLSRLRLAAGVPLLAEQIVLPLEPFEAILGVPDSEFGPLLYRLYALACGQVIARAEETLTFAACPPAQARLLRRQVGAPVAVIERVAYGIDGQPKEWRRSYGPAERLHYCVEIR